jgi:hypothetical protein
MFIGLCPACKKGDHADHEDVHSLPSDWLISDNDPDLCGGGMCICICIDERK